MEFSYKDDPAGLDLSFLPGVILKKIAAQLGINDRLNFAATCRSFHEAVFASDIGSQLLVLCTSEVHRVRVKELTTKCLDEVIFVAEQVNLADPRAEDQDEFFFERRKLLLEAENQQHEVLSSLVEKFREVIRGEIRFISLRDADWNVEHLAIGEKKTMNSRTHNESVRVRPLDSSLFF